MPANRPLGFDLDEAKAPKLIEHSDDNRCAARIDDQAADPIGPPRLLRLRLERGQAAAAPAINAMNSRRLIR